MKSTTTAPSYDDDDHHVDEEEEAVASMAAARDPTRRGRATPARDGFHLISRQPIQWDIDWTSSRSSPPGEQHHLHGGQEHQQQVDGFVDITYHHSTRDRAARIAFNRPEVLHAFRPRTIREIQTALTHATEDPRVAVVILTSTATAQDHHHPSNTITTPAFCVGGDQTARTEGGGYLDETERAPALRVLDLQIQMRRCPKPIMAVVRGYAIGGGHILHMVADLTLASSDAVFGQTGPRMGSFDAGYGCIQAAHLMGQKRARELWFLCRFYSAEEAQQIGLINAYFPDRELDGRVAQWVRRMVMNAPTALAACKAALNAAADGAAGLAQMGGVMTGLYYQSEEAQEGKRAFLEKRAPRFRSKL